MIKAIVESIGNINEVSELTKKSTKELEVNLKKSLDTWDSKDYEEWEGEFANQKAIAIELRSRGVESQDVKTVLDDDLGKDEI